MYRKEDTTPAFERFHVVFCGKLKATNRWVILADIIPWKRIEEKYAELFCANNGRPAFPVRVALGALILKERLKISDEDLVLQIQESQYLQYFLGFEGYRDEVPFDPSMMVHFRKRLSGKILKDVNGMIIEAQKQRLEPPQEPPESGSGDAGGKNAVTLVVDATCAPEDMRFPHDVTLLDEARRKTERVIDLLASGVPEEEQKPRTYRRKARKEFLSFIRNRKPTLQKIRKALRKQLQYVERNLRTIGRLRSVSGMPSLSVQQRQDLGVILTLVDQQRYLYRHKTWSVEQRILSISKPHVRPIARGKARGMFEFGAKLSLSLVDGLSEVHRLSWEPYNECADLPSQIETYRTRYGTYPEAVCADKIYRTRENLQYCKERRIRLSGPKLGRPYQDTEKNRERLQEIRRQERADERARIPVEGKFGEGKRRYSLSRVMTRLKETSESSNMLVFLVMNLMAVARKRASAFFAEFFDMIFRTSIVAIRRIFLIWNLG